VSGPDLELLASHLDEETAALLGVLVDASDVQWQAATPSPGWTVADQVSHLAYFDEAATASVLDAVRFDELRNDAIALGVALCDEVAARYRAVTPAALLVWWRDARAAMVTAMLAAGPSRRVPWYGPDFSVASAMTGRIMETWAHGQDVYDALGEPHRVTGALYDVARLCARTRANSYASRGQAVPAGDVAVELAAPGGTTWRFGGEATAVVRGDAVEFCLVATQRRNLADTSIETDGPGAREWLEIAQAFAGPPGPGRAASGVAP